MPDPKNTSAGTEPPPPVTTYINPRRTSPEKSITLRHHRLARDASKRYSPPNIPAVQVTSHSSQNQEQLRRQRRNSSGESNETGASDPKRWFDGLNQNSKGNLDTMDMDLDTPFYQRETDSSNEEPAQAVPTQSPAYRFVQNRSTGLRPGLTQSSSADDYRSVIDDLTIENKRLKEELKRYRQMGPDSLRKDKLFEVKFHGLPSRKKRELEAALRDFTTSMEGSTPGGSPSRKKSLGKSKNMQTSTDSMSKHASSSSGSHSRPVDSAYASMSTGPSSSVPSLPNALHGRASRQRNDLNVQNYLRDIPEGLWPRPQALTEKDKKKLVVKRLEHLFTGKLGGAQHGNQYIPTAPQPIAEDVEMKTNTTSNSDERTNTSNETTREATREAQIRPRESRSKQTNSRDNGSTSNSHSNGEGTDSRDNGNGSGSGSGHVGQDNNGNGGNNLTSTTTTQGKVPPEQRPTRPRDLDPDRAQVPSENVDYIRHLGLVLPDSGRHYSAKDVSPDAEGWVYLNLLCNLAQLHILNVTPDFIRSAVSEKSTKFQLSPDGRKIRWRGGIEGTRFSSDSSGSSSQKGQSDPDTDGSNGRDQRKKQKTAATEDATRTPQNDVIPHKSSGFKPRNQESNSSEDFHYKPLFVHHQTSSSDEQPSVGDETGSSYGPPEESNLGLTSRWGQSGVSGTSQQRKRRRDGAIIYYGGAPFCTDLSGDLGEVSPDGYEMTSSGDQGPIHLDIHRPNVSRSTSGSSIPFRPLSHARPARSLPTMDVDDDSTPDLTTDDSASDDIEANLEWSDGDQRARLISLDASGLAGIYPEDHFIVMVATRRPKSSSSSVSSDDGQVRPKLLQKLSNETSDSKVTADSIISKLANMTTSSPLPVYASNPATRMIEIEYVTGKLRRLSPVPLPPPTFFFPDANSDESDDDTSEYDVSDGFISRRVLLANERQSSENDDLSGNDEEDEHSDDEMHEEEDVSIASNEKMIPETTTLPSSRGRLPPLTKMNSGSSAATAGGAVSGYNSSVEDA